MESTQVRDALVASSLVRPRVGGDDDVDETDAAKVRDEKKRVSAALATTRDALVKRCVDVLYEYRVACASKSPPGQLILPESIKLLPLLAVGALKGPLLRGANDLDASGPDACDRAATLEVALVAPTACVARLAYPRLYALSCGGPSGDDACAALPASGDSDDGARVLALDAGLRFYVKLPKDAAADYKSRALAALRTDLRPPTGGATPPVQVHPPDESGDALRDAVALLGDALDRDAPRAAPVTVLDDAAFHAQATAGEAANKHQRHSQAFANLLVEDKTIHGMSYVDFLCSIHRQIQSKQNSAGY